MTRDLPGVILSQEMFWDIIDLCFGRMGPLADLQYASPSYRAGHFTPEEEIRWTVMRLLEEIRQAWDSPSAMQTMLWLEKPSTMALLIDSQDRSEGATISERVVLVQRFVAQALERFSSEETASQPAGTTSQTWFDVSYYLRSDEAVARALDAIYAVSPGPISIREEVVLTLRWVLEEMSPAWNCRPVAVAVQWIRGNTRLVNAIAESDYCAQAGTPEVVHFVCALCSEVLERVVV